MPWVRATSAASAPFIDVLASAHRDGDAARRLLGRALAALKVTPTEVATDSTAIHPAVLDEHPRRVATAPFAWASRTVALAEAGRVLTREARVALNAVSAAELRTQQAGARERRLVLAMKPGGDGCRHGGRPLW